ncbi:MAG: flagellar hook-associated protein FlgK, partial [Selenomonadaceae bacterium]|nr:flagellar hook-associated protein FlgK [Selenomonadaceae bacterium]
MRSTFAGLNTMVRGIFAHQLMQDTTGHNIVNAGTEGYSRQRVNLTPTRSLQQTAALGFVEVGTGVDAMSITRARNIYADKQFRQETANENYLEAIQLNYDKLEAIFDDSGGTGIQNSMMKFYQSWVDLSANASTTANRVAVVEQGKVLSDVFQYATTQLQNQINATYDQLSIRLGQVNELTDKIINVNQQIAAREVVGDNANDLRDQRDLLVDDLSQYMEVVITEQPDGKFTINSEGITIVNGVAKLTLSLSNGVASREYGVDYGVTDYTIHVDQSDIVYAPTTGSLGGDMEAIAINKSYIDDIASMAAFMLTTFNEQHKAGYGLIKSNAESGTENYTGINFYGTNGTMYAFYRDEFEHEYVLMYR